MEKLFEIATNIKTPLALGGLIALIFFLIVKKIISKTDIPKSVEVRATLLNKVINFSFILAVLAVILGFLGYISAYTGFTLYINKNVKVAPIEVKPIHITVDVNVKTDRALNDFFSEIDEAGANTGDQSVVIDKEGERQ